MSARETITEAVRRELSGLVDVPPPDVVRQMVAHHVAAWQEASQRGLDQLLLVDVDRLVTEITETIVGLGDVGRVLAIPGVEEVTVEGPHIKYLIDGVLHELLPGDAAANLHAVNQLLTRAGAVLDASHPVADGVQVLGGKARLTAAIPPVSPHLSANLRLYVARSADLTHLVAEPRLTLSEQAAEFLRLVVRSRGSIVISGTTGSGKTTMLAALLREVRSNHAVRMVEETFEVQFTPLHGGRYQVARLAGADSLQDLVKLCLRYRPDFIVVGEVRGAEAWDLAWALQVGAGCMATVHAASAEYALEVLVLLALRAGAEERLVRRTFADSINVVVHCERDDPNMVAEGDAYLHQVTEIRVLAPQLSGTAFTSEPLFAREALGKPMEWTGVMPPPELVARLERQLAGGTIGDVLAAWSD